MADKKIKYENTAESVIECFGGKGGHPESESILIDSNLDKKDGYVTFWSDNATAAKIAKRSKKYIKEIRNCKDGVQLKIDRKAFRGIEYCFKIAR
jgi:hypothetical protein